MAPNSLLPDYSQMRLPLLPPVLVMLLVGSLGALLFWLLAVPLLGAEKLDSFFDKSDDLNRIVSDLNRAVDDRQLPDAFCGNRICENRETIDTCFLDCFICNGNGVCEASIGETTNSCPSDCANSPGLNPVDGFCGDTFCATTESCDLCAVDCGICTPASVCGNNVREENEVCDGTALDGATCTRIAGDYNGGTLSCNSTCTGFVTTNCTREILPVNTCAAGDGCLNGCTPPDMDCETVFSKLKFGYTYSYNPAQDVQNWETALSAGINSLIVFFSENFEVGGQNGFDALDPRVQTIAAFSAGHDVKLFPNLHVTRAAEQTRQAVVYDPARGMVVSTNRLPALDRQYWSDIQSTLISMATMTDAPHGVFLDMELYGEQIHAPYFWSLNQLDDETFSEFVLSVPALQESDPPVSVDRRSERFDFLVAQELRPQYYAFVRAKAQELSSALATAVHAVNPDFVIGQYPSPIFPGDPDNYVAPLLFDFLQGYARNGKPPMMFGTDRYYHPATRVRPVEIRQLNHNGTVLFQRQDTGEELTLFYVSGFLFRNYVWPFFTQEGTMHGEAVPSLLQSAKQTSGYWLFSFLPFFESPVPADYRLPTAVGCDVYSTPLQSTSPPSCCFYQWCLEGTNTSSAYCPLDVAGCSGPSCWAAMCQSGLEDARMAYWDAIGALNVQLSQAGS